MGLILQIHGLQKITALVIWICCVLLRNGREVEASLETYGSFQYLPATPFADQPYRTAYHFQSRKNWLNDPNGPMYYKGVYHLFYQYNPAGATFSNIMVWAHSISYDLINWIQLDLALTPSEPFDINSCWSGSVTILPDNTPVILYTGIDANKHQVQNLAHPKNLSDPLLKEWVKFSQNPLITPPDGVAGDNFRDPTTAWKGQDGNWRVLIGGMSNDKGMAMLYLSKDFLKWTKHQDPLYSSERTGMWECPDFYPVCIDSGNGVDVSDHNSSNKHVMKASFNEHDYYILGSYTPETERFLPDSDLTGTSSDLRYDYGKFYASKSFFDSAKNRRVLWAWVNESDSKEDDIKKGWSGLQSFPRKVWLDRTGKQLVQWPIKEISTLHDKKVSFFSKKLESGSIFEVSGVTASQADVEVIFELPELEEAELIKPGFVDPQLLCDRENALTVGRLGPFGLLALATKGLSEQTAIFFRVYKSSEGFVVLMCSDQSRSSLTKNIDKTTYGAFIDIDPRHKKISLRTLIDHSIIESFGGEGRTCITARVYPKLAIGEDAHLYAFNNGSQSVIITRLTAWSMKKAHINGLHQDKYDASEVNGRQSSHSRESYSALG